MDINAPRIDGFLQRVHAQSKTFVPRFAQKPLEAYPLEPRHDNFQQGPPGSKCRKPLTQLPGPGVEGASFSPESSQPHGFPEAKTPKGSQFCAAKSILLSQFQADTVNPCSSHQWKCSAALSGQKPGKIELGCPIELSETPE